VGAHVRRPALLAGVDVRGSRPAVTFPNFLLAAIIVYIPYQQHYPVVLDLKGLNIINVIFLTLLFFATRPKPAEVMPTPLKGRFILFMVALTLAFLIGEAYDNSTFADDLTVLKTDIFYMLFYFLFYHAVRDVKSIRVMFAAILFVSFLVSLQGLRQALDYGIGNFKPGNRVTGPFAQGTIGGANLAAAYYVIFVPLFFSVFLLCKSRPVLRIVCLALTGLGMFAAFFTYSRQAYFILAALFLLQAMRRNFIVAILILAAVLSYDVWAPAGVVERIQMTEQKDERGDVKLDESTESRFILWEAASQIISGRPWGIGLNHFKREIGTYAPGYQNFDAHNGYVLVTAETGFFGVLSMVWLMLGMVFLARKVEKLDDSEETRLLGSSFLISALAVMLSNLFGTRMFDGEVMGNFWVLAALAARYYTIAMERRAAAKAAPEGPPLASPATG
jgi:O-antigen ligase